VPGAEVFRVSIIELQSGNPERNIRLQAGDTVYVPRAAQVYISGSVAKPGPIRFQEGMTLLQALTVAGGATERGSQGRAKVLRTVEGKKQEVKIKLTDLVQPEDTIIVPERFF
jgi:polysaccharide export outer membrane protein